ncbi:hypothetical protein WMY93_033230 [Mugilogobius chulae]|uniref:C2H2-type domain-containing protein n=1 Tax=Mugilogobius chulae TaxID=88201 RepID=A0AAW0MLP8_9GOBI
MLVQFPCTLCAHRANNNLRLMQHMLTHWKPVNRGDDQKSCKFCYRHFSSFTELQTHLEKVHGSAPSNSLCRICEWAFDNEPVFLNHMKTNHKPGEMPYICQVCFYRSSFYSDVIQHFAVFHRETRFLLCVFCLKVLKNSEMYQQHLLRHQVSYSATSRSNKHQQHLLRHQVSYSTTSRDKSETTRRLTGRLFYSLGAATAKERSPHCLYRTKERSPHCLYRDKGTITPLLVPGQRNDHPTACAGTKERSPHCLCRDKGTITPLLVPGQRNHRPTACAGTKEPSPHCLYRDKGTIAHCLYRTKEPSPHCLYRDKGTITPLLVPGQGTITPLLVPGQRNDHPTACTGTKERSPHCLCRDKGTITPLLVPGQRNDHPTACIGTKEPSPHCLYRDKGTIAPLLVSDKGTIAPLLVPGQRNHHPTACTGTKERSPHCLYRDKGTITPLLVLGQRNYHPTAVSGQRNHHPTACIGTKERSPHCLYWDKERSPHCLYWDKGTITPLLVPGQRNDHPTACTGTKERSPHCLYRDKRNHHPTACTGTKERSPHCLYRDKGTITPLLVPGQRNHHPTACTGTKERSPHCLYRDKGTITHCLCRDKGTITPRLYRDKGTITPLLVPDKGTITPLLVPGQRNDHPTCMDSHPPLLYRDKGTIAHCLYRTRTIAPLLVSGQRNHHPLLVPGQRNDHPTACTGTKERSPHCLYWDKGTITPLLVPGQRNDHPTACTGTKERSPHCLYRDKGTITPLLVPGQRNITHCLYRDKGTITPLLVPGQRNDHPTACTGTWAHPEPSDWRTGGSTGTIAHHFPRPKDQWHSADEKLRPAVFLHLLRTAASGPFQETTWLCTWLRTRRTLSLCSERSKHTHTHASALCSERILSDSDVDRALLERSDWLTPISAVAPPPSGDWSTPESLGAAVAPFLKKCGPTYNLSKAGDALDFFNLLFPAELVQLIATETNAHVATQRFLGNDTPPSDWTKLSTDEFKAFLGLTEELQRAHVAAVTRPSHFWHIAGDRYVRFTSLRCDPMGLQNLPDTAQYWSYVHYDHSYMFNQVMSHRRFTQILQWLRPGCADPAPTASNPAPKHRSPAPRSRSHAYIKDPLQMFRQMLRIQGRAMWDAYKPRCCLSLDRALLPGTSSQDSNQNQDKPRPGPALPQVWLLCDSKSGYCHRLHIQISPGPSLGPSSSLILDLLFGLENHHHQLFLSNSLCTVDLLKALHDRGVYGSASFPRNHPHFPPELWVDRPLEQPGDFVQKQSGVVLATRWMDVKEMGCLSTNAAPGQKDTVWRRSQSKPGTLDPLDRPQSFRLLQENIRGGGHLQTAAGL